MITRKIRIDISQFDPNWKSINNGTEDCYMIFMSRPVEDSIKQQTSLLKAKRLLERKVIEYDNLREKINSFLTQGREVTEAMYKEEEVLEKAVAKLSKDMIDYTIQALEERFVFGVIYDEGIKKTREIKREEIKEIDMEVIKYINERLTGGLEKKG